MNKIYEHEKVLFGELLDYLKNVVKDKNKLVRLFYNNMHVYLDGEIGSYRGDYSNIYVGYTEDYKRAKNVNELIQIFNAFLENGTMEGYKGGEFAVRVNCEVYVDMYGCYNEQAIVKVFDTKEHDVLIHVSQVNECI